MQTITDFVAKPGLPTGRNAGSRMVHIDGVRRAKKQRGPKERASLSYGTASALDRRAQILEIIRERPGITMRGIGRITGLATGVTRHHTMVLQRCGAIWIHRFGCNLMHFAGTRPTTDRVLRRRLFESLDNHHALIYDIVCTEAPRQKEIISAMPFGRSTTQHRLGYLTRMGLITRGPHERDAYTALPIASREYVEVF